jgi:hypothetical protein
MIHFPQSVCLSFNSEILLEHGGAVSIMIHAELGAIGILLNEIPIFPGLWDSRVTQARRIGGLISGEKL